MKNIDAVIGRLRELQRERAAELQIPDEKPDQLIIEMAKKKKKKVGKRKEARFRRKNSNECLFVESSWYSNDVDSIELLFGLETPIVYR